MSKIDSTAIIHSSAEIDEDVEIGPYCIVGKRVTIGAGSVLMAHSVVAENTTLGKRNKVFPYVVLGTPAQDLKSSSPDNELIIGDDNVFREFVTVHRGTEHDLGKTVIGNGNYLMAYVHIAHDCVLEDGIIMANGVQIGGHCYIERYSNFGGLAALHHFVTVGRYSFVGGLTRIVRDVPPFMIVEGNPAEVRSVNFVGLKRRGFSAERVELLKKAFKILFYERLPLSAAIEEVENSLPKNEDITYLIESLKRTMKGKSGRAREITRWKEEERKES